MTTQIVNASSTLPTHVAERAKDPDDAELPTPPPALSLTPQTMAIYSRPLMHPWPTAPTSRKIRSL
jgi:hypothetical protein